MRLAPALPALALLLGGLLLAPLPRRFRLAPPAPASGYERARDEYRRAAELRNTFNGRKVRGLRFGDLVRREEAAPGSSRAQAAILVRERIALAGAAVPGEPAPAATGGGDGWWSLDACRARSRAFLGRSVAWYRVEKAGIAARVLRISVEVESELQARIHLLKRSLAPPPPPLPAWIRWAFGGDAAPVVAMEPGTAVRAEEALLSPSRSRAMGEVLGAMGEIGPCPLLPWDGVTPFPDFIDLEWVRSRTARGSREYACGDPRAEALLGILREALVDLPFAPSVPAEEDVDRVAALRGAVTDAPWFRKCEESLAEALDF